MFLNQTEAQMKFEWRVVDTQTQILKSFLKQKGISKRLLAKIKFHGGKLYVNHEEKTVRHTLQVDDIVTVYVPNEESQDNVYAAHLPIDILYEDDHILVVNKPHGVISIPSYAHPHYSMANRVKGYFVKKNYENQVIHVVTRLDRDTSGVMLFAKHQFAHALLDEQLRAHTIDKQYIAIGTHLLPEESGFISAPIQRCPDSIMKRQVAEDGDGKPALTEYTLIEKFHNGTMYRVKLHTGRTHQIRVHFTHKQSPLVGDTLYGSPVDPVLDRQALHCESIRFNHPFTKEVLICHAPLPEDIQKWIDKERELKNG